MALTVERLIEMARLRGLELDPERAAALLPAYQSLAARLARLAEALPPEVGPPPPSFPAPPPPAGAASPPAARP